MILDVGRLFPVTRIEDLAAERAVLGAILSGALKGFDVALLDEDDYHYRAHGLIHGALGVVADHRELWTPAQRRLPGLPIGAAIAVCELRGLKLGRRYIRALALRAPGRAEAILALDTVRHLAGVRRDAEAERGRMIGDLCWWAKQAALHISEQSRGRELVLAAELKGAA